MSKDLFLQLTEDPSKDNPRYNSSSSYFEEDYSFLDDPALESNTYENLGSDLWSGLSKGLASGLTFGASEFLGEGFEINWSEMSNVERASYGLGEFATMLIPFMGMGKAVKGLTALSKFGAKGAIKEAAKQTIKQSDIATAGALKQAKKIAKATGRTTEEVMSEIAPKLQKKVYKDLTKKEGRTLLNPMRKPFLDDVYNQAAKGDIKKFSNDAIRNRVRASMEAGLTGQGIKLGSRQLDNMAGEFAEQIGKGVKFSDANAAWSTRLGRGVGDSWYAKYLGHAGNLSTMMIADQMIRQRMHHETRGTEFDPISAVQSGVFMGALFPAVQAIPNVLMGTGYRGIIREGLPLAFGRLFGKTNYSKMAQKVGEKPVRGLLKMQTKGGLFDVNNSSMLGDSFFSKGLSREYNGAYDVLRRIDDMPMDDVVGLLNKYKGALGKEVSKRWAKEWFKDAIGSSFRVGVGVSIMNHDGMQEY